MTFKDYCLKSGMSDSEVDDYVLMSNQPEVLAAVGRLAQAYADDYRQYALAASESNKLFEAIGRWKAYESLGDKLRAMVADMQLLREDYEKERNNGGHFGIV